MTDSIQTLDNSIQLVYISSKEMKRLNYRKLDRLKRNLKQMNSCLIAFSGGVDSSFLLRVAKDILGKNILAVTAVSETYPREELKQAKKLTKTWDIRHLVIKTREYNNPNFRRNPFNRCYYCKSELFHRLRLIAKKNKISYIFDGSNVDDKYDFRPGEKAKKRFGIRSPLREAGFTKKDIRVASKVLKLPNWDKPSLACLASRFPYGSRLSKKDLNKIDKAESFIRSLGIRQVRVRHHGDLARIEVEKKDILFLIKNYQYTINHYLRKIGYSYITVDLQGYRTGSMNPDFSDKKNRFNQ